ncbi:MAG: methionyl-tRNA formyltransferase [Ruminococcaceae bacterium]|nr:methionyl-tRNA formyltransferase [Oscillospiraceae bacterium]
MRILFMGTPDFALFSLDALVKSGEEVVGVVTQPDKPKGRGYTLTPPPVKVYAMEHGIKVYQPATLKDGAFLETLEKLAPEMIVVVAYGKILPKYVLDFPKYGCINIHGSLLPKYRGAAPMQRAIIDGEKVTGVTSMYMAEGLDTGDMLIKEEVEIAEDDNFESVHDKLGEAGARVLLLTVDAAKQGTLKPEKQDDSLATHTSKIEKGDCLIDFSADAHTIHNKIRGLSPFPLAFTHMPNGKLLKIVKAHFEAANGGSEYGKVVRADKGGIAVCAKDGLVVIEVATPEGKKAQSAADLVNGRQISLGDILGVR